MKIKKLKENFNSYLKIRTKKTLNVFFKLKFFFKNFIVIFFNVKKHCGSYQIAFIKFIEIIKNGGVRNVLKKVDLLLIRAGYIPKFSENKIDKSFLYEKPLSELDYQPLVTIIVPNYNHGAYLRERLDSIYSQSYKKIEVLLLDDMSSDNSQEILSEYMNRYPEKTTCIFNEKNSGGVFYQWKRGIEMAKGDLIWIAESDDYCSKNFLEVHVRNFRDEAVMLSFSRSVFVKDDSKKVVWSTEEYLSEFGVDIWKKEFKNTSHSLVNRCWGKKNIIPNVSSALFRNPFDLSLLKDPSWYGMRVCGDWVFYLHIIRGGLVAYTPDATNYYRQHSKNTSVSSQSKDIYYKEYARVAEELVQLYQLDDSVLLILAKYVKEQWLICRENEPISRLESLFNIEHIKKNAIKRKPNIVMLVYSLIAGGGETFPILLANLLKENGYGVTVLNCHEQPNEIGVRSMLRYDIPLIHLKRLDYAPAVLKDLGTEIIHSHHAWVDMLFVHLLQNSSKIAHVISMHGMYEMFSRDQLNSILPLIENKIKHIVYTAEKNILPFPPGFLEKKEFTRIDNALPITLINRIDRKVLGISEKDFVLCLVSRGIPEKGWDESIEAVKIASKITNRKIHLLIIGEGPEYDRLQPNNPFSFIHFLGFKQNIRDYFALADVGIIPSRFQGESFPLVLIDCLQAGTPIIASRIGEIPYMLQSDTGMAGVLFDLQNWAIPVDGLAQIIAELAINDSKLLSEIKGNVENAANKFDPKLLFEKYDTVYSKVLLVS